MSPTTAVNFNCEHCKTENSVEVQTGGRNDSAVKFKCGFCQGEQAEGKIENAPKQGNPVHQWIRGEEGWEQVF